MLRQRLFRQAIGSTGAVLNDEMLLLAIMDFVDDSCEDIHWA